MAPAAGCSMVTSNKTIATLGSKQHHKPARPPSGIGPPAARPPGGRAVHEARRLGSRAALPDPAAALAEAPAVSSSQPQHQHQHHQQQRDETPWIRLLCYNPAAAAQLQATAQSAALELHPVSGEVEVDWDYDAKARYRRLDEETLQCLVAVEPLGLGFRLVLCTEGWKVGEVTVVPAAAAASSSGIGGGGGGGGGEGSLFASVFGGSEGHKSLQEAEAAFKQSKSASSTAKLQQPQSSNNHDNEAKDDDNDDDDDDDDYWAQYDAATSTQATPQPPRTPAGANTNNSGNSIRDYPGFAGQGGDHNDDDYYAQYDDVQPAMDNHDPDEEMVDLAHGQREAGPLAYAQHNRQEPLEQKSPETEMAHPTPSRSNSSAGSTTSVEKLEAVAQRLEQSEFGVKQHVSRTMKSLYMLARASGIERQEFERLVRVELDMLPMMDENE
ncbi:uncharacterized protein B0I36DRAFT_346991 [Microdochium trichocladiopsis]|uniref:Uncharacterized protein n=1 Tax=Microdochium trichocladiopsis TaxID=1682393 RepID=A0A9P8YC40_9PEZI|nr:uncharacterized protein B0I36DRAFT_346991 [Microdochium trichocladiopsis]KAH7035165.1 hypothetical protein B0I36DRAFT_346991 [Microdochium trichocladiopsis]